MKGPVAFVELLGRSLLEHVVDQFSNAGVNTTLVVHRDVFGYTPHFRRTPKDLSVCIADETWSAVASVLRTYSTSGIDTAFLVRPNAHVEADFDDFLSLHSAGKHTATRASDLEGPMDLWVVNSNIDPQRLVATCGPDMVSADYAESYFVREYVKRLTDPHDFRQLVVDSFHSRCNLRPVGSQVRPGIWVDANVQIRRGVRVVGPAYLGRNCIIGESALITRSSNIESGSHVDYGTAIEDSSVLCDTYVGMWLDVRHSIVSANKLLNIERGVLVEISDPSLLRSNGAEEKNFGGKPAMGTADIVRAKQSLAEQPSFGRSLRAVNTRTEIES